MNIGTQKYPFSDVRDEVTEAIIHIDFAHHEIHEGDAFTCNYSQSTPTAIGEMTMIAFKTSDSNKIIHIFCEASSTAGSIFTIYEDSNLDLDEGSDLTIYNRNRNSSKISTVSTIETIPELGKATSFTVIQAGSANLSTSKPIWKKYLGAATVGADTSGESRDGHEFMLKKNAQYAFVIENTSADDNTHNLVLSWYEHTSIV